MATATYTPIATQTLGSAAASITFSSIPGTYTDLRLVLTCTTSAADYVFLKLNGDPTGSYSQTQLQGSGTAAASSGSSTGIAYIPISVTTNSTSTTIPELFTTDIFSYAGSTNKTLLATSAQDQNGSGYVTATTGLYRSTSAITIISLGLFNGSNFSTGTIATLWGI